MIRSVDMQNNSGVLLRAPILSGKGWTFEAADSRRTLGQADVIDLNGNGVDTTQRGGFMVGDFSYNDPALSVSLRQLREIARQKGTEVLTGHDLPPGKIQVDQRGVSERFFTRETRLNPRSLDQLARHEVPGCATTAWAIDTVTAEFLVYDKSAPGMPVPPPVVAAPPQSVTAAPVATPAVPLATPAPPVATPAVPLATPRVLSPISAPRAHGGGLLAGCAIAMGGIVLASAVQGPAGLGVLAAGFLTGGAVAIRFS